MHRCCNAAAASCATFSLKVNKCKAFGVNVVQHGQHILEAKDHATSAPQFKVKYQPPSPPPRNSQQVYPAVEDFTPQFTHFRQFEIHPIQAEGHATSAPQFKVKKSPERFVPAARHGARAAAPPDERLQNKRGFGRVHGRRARDGTVQNVCCGNRWTNTVLRCCPPPFRGSPDPFHLPPRAQGMRYINGYDDVEIVAGAGTMGMEILEQVRACGCCACMLAGSAEWSGSQERVVRGGPSAAPTKPGVHSPAASIAVIGVALLLILLGVLCVALCSRCDSTAGCRGPGEEVALRWRLPRRSWFRCLPASSGRERRAS